MNSHSQISRAFAIENGRLVRREGLTHTKSEAHGFSRRKVTREIWRQGLDKHRDDGPSFIERDLETGIITCEIWHRNGQIHRADDLPAWIRRDPFSGITTQQEWWENNGSHRIGAPNFIEIDPMSGIIINEGWGKRGVFHRVEGPAWITRDPRTEVIISEEWWLEGNLHREDAPAEIERNPKTGEIIYQQYWRHGVSPDGPHHQVCSSPEEMAQSVAECLQRHIVRRAGPTPSFK